MADDKTFTQEQLDTAIAAAVGKVQESIDKLEAKNEELVGDLRKAKATARAASEIKPQDLTAAEERADNAEKALVESDKQVKALTKERDTAVKNLETETGFTQKLLIQDGLKTALIANGVKDEDYIDMAVAKFTGGAKVVTEGDERKAMYGDKPLGDFIKEWAGTEAGKKIVAAPANGGGGAPGGKIGDGADKTVTRAEFDAKDGPAKVAFAKEGGKVVDATS